jgi:serpin B
MRLYFQGEPMNTLAIKFFSLTISLSMILAACAPSASLSVAESNKSRKTNPTVPEGDIKSLVDGNNAFALDMYNSLRAENGNLILSPYSISLALAMTYAGARGETESQMAQTLHFPQGAQEKLHPAFNTLDLALEKKPVNLNKDQEPMKLGIANALWAEQTYTFRPDFLDTLALNYGAGVHLADFHNQAEPVRKAINGWVSDETKDKINDLLPQDSVGPDTRMVLVNAIYFKADWLAQFDANSTGDAPFYLTDGTQVTTKMMHESMLYPYMQGNGYQAVELAYAGETAAMDIIVPDAGNFETFEESFNKETLDQALSGMQSTNMALGLPKFEFTKDFSLSDALASMGMSDAFNSDLANFSGMSDKKDLYIGDVIHKAFVAVDEKGTEAAAATAVIMEGATAIRHDVNLQIDRPFIFVIRDTVNRQILFIGRVMNPAG